MSYAPRQSIGCLYEDAEFTVRAELDVAERGDGARWAKASVEGLGGEALLRGRRAESLSGVSVPLIALQ